LVENRDWAKEREYPREVGGTKTRVLAQALDQDLEKVVVEVKEQEEKDERD